VRCAGILTRSRPAAGLRLPVPPLTPLPALGGVGATPLRRRLWPGAWAGLALDGAEGWQSGRVPSPSPADRSCFWWQSPGLASSPTSPITVPLCACGI